MRSTKDYDVQQANDQYTCFGVKLKPANESSFDATGKVLTRGYFDRNKHIYPASKWEILSDL